MVNKIYNYKYTSIDNAALTVDISGQFICNNSQTWNQKNHPTNHHSSDVPVGWWYTYPYEKWWSESQLGWWHSQLKGKLKQIMFQSPPTSIYVYIYIYTEDISQKSPFLLFFVTTFHSFLSRGIDATTGSNSGAVIIGSYHWSNRWSAWIFFLSRARHRRFTGWWFQPSWKIWKSMGRIILYIMENNKCSKPPTSSGFHNCHRNGLWWELIGLTGLFNNRVIYRKLTRKTFKVFNMS